MVGSRAAALTVATFLGCAALLPSSGAASTPWRTHIDQVNHFALATPSGWIWIPHTKSAALRLAASLRAQGRLHQAALVKSFATDAWQTDPTRIFDAIAYPATGSPIATDLVVTRKALPSGVSPTQSSLKEIAQVLYDGFKSQRGTKMREPRPLAVSLDANPSYLISGSVPAVGFGGRRTGFVLYLLIDRRGLYSVTFRTDSSYLSSQHDLFRRIARTARLG
jgi:hypothetical protein